MTAVKNNFETAMQSVVQFVGTIKALDKDNHTTPALIMSYVGIDMMGFLSMPAGKEKNTRSDFITWVDLWLKGHPDQPYQYIGKEVYAARCAMLHTYGSEADMHREDPTIKKFGYNDGGKHIYRPDVSPQLVLIGIRSFTNDFITGVGEYLQSVIKNKPTPDFATRVSKFLHTYDYPND